MATETFPSQYLRGALNSGYSITRTEGFYQSNPAAGAPYKVVTTNDLPVTFNLTFAMDGGKKRLFNLWGVEKLDNWRKPFNIDLDIEAGLVTQEAEFIQGGIPQVTRTEAGIYFYSAQVLVKQLVNPDLGNYDTLEYLAENSPCNDPERGMEILDIVINEILPES